MVAGFNKYLCLTLLLASLTISSTWAARLVDDRYDPHAALEFSQQAIGRTLGDHSLVDSDGKPVSLHDFAGKPMVVSMIFTSCHHACPMTTKRLEEAARAAREVLGQDSFEIVTVGFDAANDTPEAMGAFARRQRVNEPGWRFLSADQATIEQISDDLGFIFFPTARGFDHLNQSTIINRDGVVYRQVYGVTFELPWLVEPLKELVFNRPGSAGHLVAGLVDRIKLFCTVYDPTTGRYRFDNSLFVRAAAGLIFILGVLFYLTREIIIARRSNKHE